MQVSKWGDSLAIRLPAGIVEAYTLKEGDEVEISIIVRNQDEIDEQRIRDEAIQGIREMNWTLPPDYKFDREEINRRGSE